jgi:hypothetical protein
MQHRGHTAPPLGTIHGLPHARGPLADTRLVRPTQGLVNPAVGPTALPFGRVIVKWALRSIWRVHGEIGSSWVLVDPSIDVLHTFHPQL